MADGRPFSIYAVAAGAIFATAAVVLWSRITPEVPAQFVDLTAAAAPERAAATDTVRFAVESVWGPERTSERHFDLVRHVTREIDRPLRIVERLTYAEVNELLRRQGVDAAIVGTGAFLAATRDGIALTVIAVPVTAEGPVYHSVFVVRTDSLLQTIDDLDGRALGLSDPLSLSGSYYPLAAAIDRGKDPSTFYSRTMYTYGDDGSLRAVVDRTVDVAVVDSLAYDYDGPHRALREIHRSPALGISPVVVPSAANPQFVAALRRAFLTMHQQPRGREVLAALHLQRFEEPAPGLYDEATRIFDVARQRPDAGE